MSSTTKNLFEKRFLDFQKLLVKVKSSIAKVLGGVGTLFQKGSDLPEAKTNPLKRGIINDIIQTTKE